jgi:parallel beta-helix repeat protein
MKKLLLVLPLLFLLTSCEEEPNVNYEKKEITTSNVTVDCKNSFYNEEKVTELFIHGKIQNVTIQNCKLKGSIKIYGLGVNGQAEAVRESSKKENHTKNAQENAPSNILISNVTIEGYQKVPVYISPGVTKVTIEKSSIIGISKYPLVYLDAESGYNTIKDNVFDLKDINTVTSYEPREIIAIDGSAFNKITNNTFNSIMGGGIYLYRNCGEGGTIRHQSPQYNTIEGNKFIFLNYYSSYGIWLNSRNGNRNYCEEDKGYNFGSSIDNRDFAANNIIKDNKFVGSNKTIMDGNN